MDPRLVRLSKFLSLVLRHAPERAGVALDDAGWVAVDDLIAGARRAGVALDRPTLERVVAGNDKQRFGLSDDGARIRARQGHSRPVSLGIAPSEPPATLYHGTAERTVPAILAEGLRPGRRTHVHLSESAATARAVGARHGRPAVLVVDAAAMHAAGHEFVRSENGVWLVSRVPAEFVRPDAG